MKYQIFVRGWWKIDSKTGKKEPHLGRKTILGYKDNEEEAKEWCRQYNDNNDPGPTSRKAEYTSSY